MHLSDLLKYGQDFKEKFAKSQQDFNHKIFEGTAGGGMILVRVKGNKQVLSIDISDELISTKEKTILIDLLITATNNALNKLNTEYQKHFGDAFGNIIPELSNLPEFPFK